MARVKSIDTKPEMLVRRYLHAHGFRYGLHNKKLPGSPDIVLRHYKTVIFVHGCFWHGHQGCKYSHLPHTNAEFWQTKIQKNMERDAKVIAELEKMGWSVIVVWECDLKNMARRESTLPSIALRLVDIKNKTSAHPYYPIGDEEDSKFLIAAEPNQ